MGLLASDNARETGSETGLCVTKTCDREESGADTRGSQVNKQPDRQSHAANKGGAGWGMNPVENKEIGYRNIVPFSGQNPVSSINRKYTGRWWETQRFRPSEESLVSFPVRVRTRVALMMTRIRFIT